MFILFWLYFLLHADNTTRDCFFFFYDFDRSYNFSKRKGKNICINDSFLKESKDYINSWISSVYARNARRLPKTTKEMPDLFFAPSRLLDTVCSHQLSVFRI